MITARFQAVFQLADIARPAVGLNRPNGILADAHVAAFCSSANLQDEACASKAASPLRSRSGGI